jgi:succinoglycan biosynthesis transport protein ExoP
MSIVQFFRILWSRALIVVIAVVASFAGAFIVTLIAQPRYEATSRVMLSLLKPDNVTGQVFANPKTVGAYIATQKEIIRDYDVAGQAAEDLGWLSEPRKIREYQARPATDTRDFRRWLSQKVADRTTATLTAGQILEITFSSGNPVEARLGADSLRKAYLNVSLASRRQEAARNAAWWAGQAEVARTAAEKAELVLAAAERESGIVMQGKNDMDSDRLRALASQAAVVPAPQQQVGGSSAANLQLAQIDAQIAQLSQSLGPNHPQMQELKARRATTAAVVAQELASARSYASGDSSRAAINSALQEQKSRVISQRDKVEKLRQLDSEVELRRAQYQKTAARAGDLQIEASVAETGMTPLGVVVTPTTPTFPNKPLILGGSLGLGFGFGLGLALLIELLNRRVRGVEDLEGSLDVPCLAVINGERQSIWAAFAKPFRPARRSRAVPA